MPEWLVKLKGEELDLKAIEELLHSEWVNVTKESDGYYLACMDFEGIAAVDEIRDRARDILRRASAAERVRCGSCLPLEIEDVFRVEQDGSRRPFSSSSFLDTFNVRVPHAPVKKGEASAFALWVKVAAVDARVDKALRILISRDTNWVNLYHILDVAIGDAGSEIRRQAWEAEGEIRRFKQTANSETTLGDEARHGRETTEPPPRPMSLGEADLLVRRILGKWLTWKSAHLPEGVPNPDGLNP